MEWVINWKISAEYTKYTDIQSQNPRLCLPVYVPTINYGHKLWVITERRSCRYISVSSTERLNSKPFEITNFHFSCSLFQVTTAEWATLEAWHKFLHRIPFLMQPGFKPGISHMVSDDNTTKPPGRLKVLTLRNCEKSLIWERLRVESLLLHIDRSQLTWYDHLIRMLHWMPLWGGVSDKLTCWRDISWPSWEHLGINP